MGNDESSQFLIQFSEDRMSATIQGRPDAELSTVSASDVLSDLEAAKIAHNDEVVNRVTQYIEMLKEPECTPESEYEIAVGSPATNGADGAFICEDSLQQQTADWCEDGAINFYSISSIVTVETDTLIGQLMPPDRGVDGVDVRGTPLPPKYQPKEVVLKDGVKLGEDGKSVFSTIPGMIIYERFELSIREVVEIHGDVDFETGSLDLTTDVMVRRNVLDNFHVKTKKNLTVKGAIEGADVEVSGNVTVRGGIVNRDKGSVTAAGDITARFCDSATVKAHGNIRVGKEVMNSRVHTEGKLILPRGSIIGGEVFARHGVEVNTLGSEAGVVTEVIVGLHPDELRQIETTAKLNAKRRARADKINQAVAPLMDQLKRLTSAQREQATELMYAAGSMEGEIAQSEEEVASLLQATRGVDPYVLVTGTIHSGTSITLIDRVVVFKRETKGPIKIMVRRIKGHTAVVAVNQLTGSILELPAQKAMVSLEPTA